MRTDTARPVRLADYRVPDYLIDKVDLVVRLDRHETLVRARLTMRPNPKGKAGAPLLLDGDGLNGKLVGIDGTPPAQDSFRIGPDQLELFDPPRQPFTLDIETTVDPTANTQLMGLYRSGAAYCTQCEAEGFRRITYFLDRPDVLSVYSTRIEAQRSDAPILLGNGNLVETGDLADGWHYAVWNDPFPKPCYLFAMVGGDLDVLSDSFTTMSGRKVGLGIYVEHGKRDRAAYAMDSLKRSMRWDEEQFGREYDLDVFNIVAVSDFNMGAMENKGLNVFNDKYILASPDTATDTDYAGIETVVAHEYFHNWTGNRITCRDWFQLCLKEGLTVFRDHEFSADQRSRPVQRIGAVRNLRATQFPEDAGPLAHNVRPELYHEINNFYTPTVYEKGAEVIRTLKQFIGADAFRRGMDLYFERYDGTAAIVEEFIACFAEASGRDLTQFMRWYSQAGTPVLTVREKYDESAQTYTLELEQSCPPTPGQQLKLPQILPIAIGLVTPDGEASLDMPGPNEANGASAEEIARGVFELSGRARRLVFRNLAQKPVPSILRGFSAPVRLEFDWSEDALLTLLAHDSDSFNRWQAAQTSATRLMQASVAAIRGGGAPADPTRFCQALGRVIDGWKADPAFAALAINLPSELDLAREIASDVDPDAIRTARQHMRGTLGQMNLPALMAIHDALSVPAPFTPDAAGSANRSMRLMALDLIAAGDPAEGARRAKHQFETADNMTDMFGSLSILALNAPAEREAALAAFYQRFANDHLVIDKWFALQAMIPDGEALARVRGLMAHPAFSMTNPNRLRSVVGTFAMANPTQFNAADGSGHDFLAEVVLDVDRRNAQVAARLLVAFRSWKGLEAKRRAAAEAALKRIAAHNDLSADVRDIVTRSLA
ncbi:aminopeptidase N [Methylocella sp. CPCC 101449]|uniref:aminopeptidase N n=1 Tax=Methylocella sp. CPCC 101449 TaxID=2987531 RepID=UPI00288D8AF3|nr:aminopeptidase N [Methylocella sp. CPCC 101449]MDT2024236.1 aminopeptidase N [Methylocella sp. CPCC 101449]